MGEFDHSKCEVIGIPMLHLTSDVLMNDKASRPHSTSDQFDRLLQLCLE